MQRIAVAAQGADGESVVGEFALEVLQLAFVLQHRELAVGVAGIIAGTEFHGIDVVAFQLLEYVFDGQLRQERCEYADFHRNHCSVGLPACTRRRQVAVVAR